MNEKQALKYFKYLSDTGKTPRCFFKVCKGKKCIEVEVSPLLVKDPAINIFEEIFNNLWLALNKK